jgi:hypothetical protein
MLLTHGTQMVNLALRIVYERCGPLCQIVISELFKEKKSIVQIMAQTNIPTKTLGRALLTLLQFNYVGCHRILEKSCQSKNVYIAKPLAIVQTIQLPLLLSFTRDAYGHLAEEVIAELAIHGRLTIDQCIQASLNKKSILKTEVLKTRFIITTKLTKEHLVEKSKKIANNGHTSFSVSASEIFGKDTNVKTHKYIYTDHNLSIALDSTLWRINFKSFRRHLQYYKCFTFIVKRYGKKAGHVLRMMLQTLENNQCKLNQMSQLSVRESSFVHQANLFVKACGNFKRYRQEFFFGVQKCLLNKNFLEAVPTLIF